MESKKKQEEKSKYRQQQQNKKKLLSIKNEKYQQQQPNWNKWKKKILKEDNNKIKISNKLNKEIINKMEITTSQICLFYKWILREMAKEKVSINKKQFDDDLWKICREVRWKYFKWAIDSRCLIRVKGQENEFIISENFLKVLKSNINRIMEKCQQLEQ
jgi:hypothetical protein